jgi:hypothetical protein
MYTLDIYFVTVCFLPHSTGTKGVMTRVTQLFLPINVLYNSRENIELDGNLLHTSPVFHGTHSWLLTCWASFFLLLWYILQCPPSLFADGQRLGLISIQLVVLRLYTLGPAAPSKTTKKNGRRSRSFLSALRLSSFIFVIFSKSFFLSPLDLLQL